MKPRMHDIGQSLIEFVVIFPLAIFLIIGFLDLGRAVFYYASLSNAVREASRFAIVNREVLVDVCDNPGDNALQDKVLEFAFGLTTPPNALRKQDITIACPLNNPNHTITVEARYTYVPITPGIAQILGNPAGIELTAQSTMRVSGASR